MANKGSRRPDRVKERAAKIEAAFSAGNVAEAVQMFNAGTWWQKAMLPHLPDTTGKRLQECWGSVAPHLDTLYEISADASLGAEMGSPEQEEIEGAAYHAALQVFLNGGDEDAAWDAARNAAVRNG